MTPETNNHRNQGEDLQDYPDSENGVLRSGFDYNFKHGGDIVKNAMEWVGLPFIHDEDDFLPDPGLSITLMTSDLNVAALHVKEVRLKFHLDHLLQELISAFKEINPIQDIVAVA